jgi:transposase
MNRDDLIRRLEHLEADLTQQRRLNLMQQQLVVKLMGEIARLKENKNKNKKAKKKARSRKERMSRSSRGSVSDDRPPKPPPRSEPENAQSPRGTPRRGPLPANLERQVEEHPVDSTRIACCETPLLEARDPLVQERRDFVKAHVRVHRLELHRAECLCCGAMHTAETPPVAMPNGSMTASLIAFIVYGKCGLHLPLVRIIEDLAAKGLPIPKTTMSNMMRLAADLLTPIVDRIVAAMFLGDLLHLDGTGIDTKHPGGPGKHRGQIAVCCNDQLTAYFYSEDKAGRHFIDFLGVGQPNGYTGRLVADAANNMDRLYDDGTITECGCWQHTRDNFVNARASSPGAAEEGIAWIGTLFDVEKAADRAGDTAAERRARRKRDSIPLLRGFFRWMRAMQGRFAPDEDLYKAIQYCWNHWRALTRFMTDGSTPMTNNLAERELGPIGRGRKAWLFAGSDAGGHWIAQLHTVVRTCQRLAIAPDEYLTWVLPKLSDLPVNRGKGLLKTLTPMAYAEAQAAA